MRNREPTTYQSFWRNREAEGGLLSYGIDRFKGSDIERKLVYSPKMDRRKRESESGQVGDLGHLSPGMAGAARSQQNLQRRAISDAMSAPPPHRARYQ